MCAAAKGEAVRTEDEVGPYLDKHALIVDNFREVHLGPRAIHCQACQEALRLAKGEQT